MQPREDLDACLTAQAPPQEDGARNRGDVLRIRIALTLGTFLLAGCAIAGTALADTSSSPTTSAPGTAAPARPTTTAPRPGPGAAVPPRSSLDDPHLPCRRQSRQDRPETCTCRALRTATDRVTNVASRRPGRARRGTASSPGTSANAHKACGPRRTCCAVIGITPKTSRRPRS
jgi:hypothetical protein